MSNRQNNELNGQFQLLCEITRGYIPPVIIMNRQYITISHDSPLLTITISHDSPLLTINGMYIINGESFF